MEKSDLGGFPARLMLLQVLAFGASLFADRALLSQGVLGLKGTLLNPTSGSLKRDLVERVYIPLIPTLIL